MPGEFVGFTRIPVVVVVAVVALEVRRGDVLKGMRFGFRELIADRFCTPIRLWVGQCVCVTADNRVRLRGGIKKKKTTNRFCNRVSACRRGLGELQELRMPRFLAARCPKASYRGHVATRSWDICQPWCWRRSVAACFSTIVHTWTSFWCLASSQGSYG